MVTWFNSEIVDIEHGTSTFNLNLKFETFNLKITPFFHNLLILNLKTYQL